MLMTRVMTYLLYESKFVAELTNQDHKQLIILKKTHFFFKF